MTNLSCIGCSNEMYCKHKEEVEVALSTVDWSFHENLQTGKKGAIDSWTRKMILEAVAGKCVYNRPF